MIVSTSLPYRSQKRPHHPGRHHPGIVGGIERNQDRAFIARFEGLTKDVRCLPIRMVNRRGTIFNRSLFSYPEIADIERAVDELMAVGHARILRESDYSLVVIVVHHPAPCYRASARHTVDRAYCLGRIQ